MAANVDLRCALYGETFNKPHNTTSILNEKSQLKCKEKKEDENSMNNGCSCGEFCTMCTIKSKEFSQALMNFCLQS